ncbi:hypothetical protein QZH41_018239 [Actinostola sp. cb2023]|nr:hypothetical protein QZH41_018239 [Actinostola sp. cb2023]
MALEANIEISKGNFQQALTIYDRILDCTEKERNENETFELLLGKAQVLIVMARYKDSVDCYRNALSISEMSESHILKFMDCLVSTQLESAMKPAAFLLGKVLCPACKGIVMAPSTLPCGHTVCSSCITKLDMKACNTCRRPIGINYKAKVNVTLRGIVCKYYPNELEACRMRLQANELLKDGKRDLALEKYIEAVKLDPNDPLLNSNISHLMIQNGQFEQGLLHANIACKVRPEWPKGFYRRGCALIGLEKRPEAAFAFLQCLEKDPTNKVLEKLATEVSEI